MTGLEVLTDGTLEATLDDDDAEVLGGCGGRDEETRARGGDGGEGEQCLKPRLSGTDAPGTVWWSWLSSASDTGTRSGGPKSRREVFEFFLTLLHDPENAPFCWCDGCCTAAILPPFLRIQELCACADSDMLEFTS